MEECISLMHTVEWLIFNEILFSRFFPNAFTQELTTQEKTIQYMSGLNKHKEILTLVL